MMSQSAWAILNIMQPERAKSLERLSVVYTNPHDLALRAVPVDDPEWMVQLAEAAAPFVLENHELFAQTRD